MSKLAIVKPVTVAEKTTHTTLDTVEITSQLIASWDSPPFQRPKRVNERVKSIADDIRHSGGVIPGILTIGVLGGKRYKLDGQHRMEAFLLSGCDTGYADVRFFFCETMAQMGEEYVKLNRAIVPMRPDDILRGLEGSYPTLGLIRETCKFAGYDMIRRNDRAPVVSMSLVLRMWNAATAEVPSASGGSALNLATTLTLEDARQLSDFLSCCFEAWGRDEAYVRLWGALNLTLCAWLYRRMVITQWSPKTPKLTRELFRKCLMSLSAATLYLDYLVGRQLGERDRSPAYDRMKKIFAERIARETDGTRPKMPAPAWASSH